MSPTEADTPQTDRNTRKPPRDSEFAGHPEFSQDAAANKPPKGIGNSEPVGDTNERTRHSDGVRPSKTGGDARKAPGAGSALARHSRDA